MSERVVAAVAAGHPLSARAGAEALALGGGAVDAAVAACLAAAVCEGALTGPGAGGFLLVRPPGGPATLLDAFVAVPGLGPGGRRLDPATLDVLSVPFSDAEQVFHIGRASVAVPGLVAGLLLAWRRYGRLPLRDLAAPAVGLARNGVRLSAEVAYLHAILEPMLTLTPACAEIYAPVGRLLGEGDVLRNPDLADVLEALGRSGEDPLTGALGEAMLAELGRGAGLVTPTDLASYRVVERDPVRTRFRGLEILTNAPPSSGGVLIAAALRRLERAGRPDGEVARLRAVADAGRFANSLRSEEFAADLARPDAWARISRRIDATLATGASDGGRTDAIGSTTHVSVIDRAGGAVSVTSSNGAGSGVVVPGTGVLLNSMLGETDLNPGGLGGLEPGTRMTSMMSPTLVMDGEEPSIAIGSAGSNRIRSAIVQTLASAIDDGLTPAEAIGRARVHHEGDGVDVEAGACEEALAALAADGHEIRRWSRRSLFFGGVSMVARTDAGVAAAGDPRRGGGAWGVTGSGRLVAL